MKSSITLIILSLLLHSSPLFGQETGVLYQYETSSGIKWKTFGDGKAQPKYKGEIKNGKPNGFGFQTYKNGNKYFGEHKNGLPNGQGRSIYPDGSMYLGEYKDGK
ncbi:MAG: membrane-binding protein, partial [SAR324 cluster bacterium]